MNDYRRDNDRYRSTRGDQRSRRDGYDSRPPRQAPRANAQRQPRAESPYRGQQSRQHSQMDRPRQERQRYQQTPSRIANRTPYVDDQMRRRAPNTNTSRSRSSQMMSQRDMRQPRLNQPAPAQTQSSLMPRLAIAAVLLVILILRFVLQGGVFGQFGSVNAQVNDQQTQLEQITNSNNDMQSKMDSMQSTIDAWNKMHNG